MSTRDGIAITGFGVVSAAGAGADCLQVTLADGREAITELESGVRGGYFPRALFPAGHGRRDSAFGASCLAVHEALHSSGLTAAGASSTGLALGTALGSLERAELPYLESTEPGLAGVCDDDLLAVPQHALTRRLARRCELGGPTSTFSTTCVSALYALEQGALDLELGRARAMVVGGVDTLGNFMQSGFSALGALATGADSGSGTGSGTGQDGLILGEAAVFLVVESSARARDRGAPVHATIAGRGIVSDGMHLTAPDEQGRAMQTAIETALAEARCTADAIDGVSITADASAAYRRMYERVLTQTFGQRKPPLATWEPTVGHVLAASGALGLVHAVLWLAQQGCVPWASGAPSRAERRAERRAGAQQILVLTVGFGGENGATVVRGARAGEARP